MKSANKREVLASPYLKKGCRHEKTKKAKRREQRANLKKDWGCFKIAS